MKKTTIYIIIMVLLMCTFLSNSEAEDKELIFSKIPWLSSEETTIDILKECGYLRSGFEIGAINNDNSTYLTEDESEFVQPVMSKDYNEVALSISLSGYVKGKVAGYPIKNIILCFAYNGDFQLVSVKLEMIGATYSELKEKLMGIYGACEEKKNQLEMISLNWKGADKSCVVLFNENADDSYELIYGRLDAAELLSNCLEIDPNDVSGL